MNIRDFKKNSKVLQEHIYNVVREEVKRKKRNSSSLGSSFTLCECCDIMLPSTAFERKKNSTVCNECRLSDGWLYALHNEAWPKVYKIGKSKDIIERLKNYSSHIPFNDTLPLFILPCNGIDELEDQLIAAFSNNIIPGKREWLQGINDPEEIIETMIRLKAEKVVLDELSYDG